MLEEIRRETGLWESDRDVRFLCLSLVRITYCGFLQIISDGMSFTTELESASSDDDFDQADSSLMRSLTSYLQSTYSVTSTQLTYFIFLGHRVSHPKVIGHGRIS